MMYDFQRALLSLYTNAALLGAFTRDPQRFFLDYDLTEREKKAITGIPLAELNAFNSSLRHKRMHVGKRVLGSGRDVVLLPFWHGSPALMWGRAEEPRMAAISSGAARIVRETYSAREALSLASLLRAFTRVTDTVSLKDVFSLARTLYARGLMGKQVFV